MEDPNHAAARPILHSAEGTHRSGSKRCAWGLLLATMASARCAPEQLPRFGEARVSISTDAPVPSVVNRLRLDLYAEDGTWQESREVARSLAEEWPATFSIFTRETQSTQRGLLRIRAYSEGRTRDYLGERYLPAIREYEVIVPTTATELCQSAPSFAPEETVPLRRGATALALPQSGGCAADKLAYVTGAHLEISEPGDYALTIDDIFPPALSEVDLTLFVREQCDAPQTELGCNDPSGTTPPKLDLHLDVGRYSVFVGMTDALPDPVVDVRLRATLSQESTVYESTDPENILPTSLEPRRLIVDRQDMTPATEPEPITTIDRLVEVELQEGYRTDIQVHLASACLGTMARLPDEHQPALTCVETRATLEPASSAQADALDTPDQWEAAACPDARELDGADAVCVRGGHFFMGDVVSGLNDAPVLPAPERIAMVSTFWMDRHEVTVHQFRNAVRAGLVLDAAAMPQSNPFGLGSTFNIERRLCTWSERPLEEVPREDFPINCISWRSARAYCRFVGGDLPTEAQWEYAAAAADRELETPYPWGGSNDQAPRCDDAVFGRSGTSSYGGRNPIGTGVSSKPGMPQPYSQACSLQEQCHGEPCDFGVQPVEGSLLSGAGKDETPSGIVGMGGNLSEFVLDELQPYDAPCWLSQPIRDPRCDTSGVAPLRAVRGGSWAFTAASMRSAERLGMPESRDLYAPFVGFRCAYGSPLE